MSETNNDSSENQNERAYMEYFISRFYGGSGEAFKKESWVETHPALIEARKRVACAQNEVSLIDKILRQMWEEVHESGNPLPDEGYEPHRFDARERGRRERIAAIELHERMERDTLMATLKDAIVKYGIKVPDKAQEDLNSPENVLDETFGHLSVAKEKFIDEFGAKHPDTGDGPKFGCHAVMDKTAPHIEVVLFMDPRGVVVPETFCDFPVKVVDGRTMGTPQWAPERFPEEDGMGW